MENYKKAMNAARDTLQKLSEDLLPKSEMQKLNQEENLESILEKEKKQRKKYFGKQEISEKHYEVLDKLEKSLHNVCLYFYNFRKIFREKQVSDLKNEQKGENIESLENLKKHFKFISKNELYWFNNEENFSRIYSFLNNGPINRDNLDDFRKYFSKSEENATRILSLVYKKKVEVLNNSSISPETIRFFDELYFALKENKGAGYFLKNYFKRENESE